MIEILICTFAIVCVKHGILALTARRHSRRAHHALLMPSGRDERGFAVHLPSPSSTHEPRATRLLDAYSRDRDVAIDYSRGGPDPGVLVVPLESWEQVPEEVRFTRPADARMAAQARLVMPGYPAQAPPWAHSVPVPDCLQCGGERVIADGFVVHSAPTACRWRDTPIKMPVAGPGAKRSG